MKAFTKYHEVFQNDDSEINMNLVREKSKLLAKQIRDIIEPVIIRRNRLDLINNTSYQNEIKNYQ